jgi:hypothetical protein
MSHLLTAGSCCECGAPVQPPAIFCITHGARIRELCAPDEATVRVCAHCSEEIQRLPPDALDWCESCQQIEGDTETISESEFEKRHA